MQKDIRVRVIHSVCLFLLFTPAAIAIAVAFTLKNKLEMFFPVFILAALGMAVIAWIRSGRKISRIYWALMLSQFVILFSAEVSYALRLVKLLLNN